MLYLWTKRINNNKRKRRRNCVLAVDISLMFEMACAPLLNSFLNTAVWEHIILCLILWVMYVLHWTLKWHLLIYGDKKTLKLFTNSPYLVRLPQFNEENVNYVFKCMKYFVIIWHVYLRSNHLSMLVIRHWVFQAMWIYRIEWLWFVNLRFLFCFK